MNWRESKTSATNVVSGLAQRRHLLRERENLRAAARVAHLFEALEDALVQPGHERVELGRVRLRRLVGQRLVVRERHAPHLRAAFRGEILEVLGEAVDEVALGDHEIDRQLNPKLPVQLVEAAARRVDVGLARGRALDQQIVGADREDDAVDRAACPVLAQQREELAPAQAVGRRIGVLRRIAAGGIEEDRLVGEPPVAVARAADAAQRPLADALLDRELQPGIDQRGGLARTRRADDDVPRQIVEAVAGRGAAPSGRRPLRRTARGASELRRVSASFPACGCATTAGQQLVALAERPQPVHQLPHEPGPNARRRGQSGARSSISSGAIRAEAEIRPRNPDEQEDQEKAQDDDEGAPQECEHGWSRVTSRSADVDDLHAAVPRTVLRIGLGERQRLGRADASDAGSPAGSASSSAPSRRCRRARATARRCRGTAAT